MAAKGALVSEGKNSFPVAVLMAVWWITEAIPIPATALLPIALFPLLLLVCLVLLAQGAAVETAEAAVAALPDVASVSAVLTAHGPAETMVSLDSGNLDYIVVFIRQHFAVSYG